MPSNRKTFRRPPQGGGSDEQSRVVASKAPGVLSRLVADSLARAKSGSIPKRTAPRPEDTARLPGEKRAPDPSWIHVERASRLITVRQRVALRRDRERFLAAWRRAVGVDSVMAGRLEFGTQDGYTGSAPLWVTVGLDGSATPLSRYWQGIPDEPASVLISPQPCYRPSTKGDPKQWRAKDLVPGWRFVILDIDAKDVEALGATVEDVIKIIRTRMPPTWALIGSGSGGVHAWWCVPPTAPDVVMALERNLCAILCGDLAQAKSRPSLRLPGTFNIKWKKAAPKTRADVRLCTILSLDEATCRIGDFDDLPTGIRKALRSRPTNGIDFIPDWIVEAAVAEYAWRGLARNERAGDGGNPALLIWNKCPACGESGTAWTRCDFADPAIYCKRTSCKGVPDLRKLAEKHGIDIPEDDGDPNERYRNHDAEARLVLPPSVMYSPDARTEEQSLIRQAFLDAHDHYQAATDTTTRLTVIESTVGAGKDYVLSREMEKRADSKSTRTDVYAATQYQIGEKAREYRDVNPDRPQNRHISVISAKDANGKGCTRPESLRLLNKFGLPLSSACGPAKHDPAKPRPRCPDRDTCTVAGGTVNLGGTTGDPIDYRTTAAYAYTKHAARKGAPVALADESMPLVTASKVTRGQLEAFARFCAGRAKDPNTDDEKREGFQTYRRVAKTVMAIMDELHIMCLAATEGARPAAGGWHDLADVDLPTDIRGFVTPEHDDDDSAFPGGTWRMMRDVVDLARHCRDFKPPASAETVMERDVYFNAGAMPWIKAPTANPSKQIFALWYRTVDRSRMPKSMVWSNASFWTIADRIERIPGLDVRRAGRTLEPVHLARLHVYYQKATRKGLLADARTEKEIAAGDPEKMHLTPDAICIVRETIRHAKDRYYLDGGDVKAPRILLGTYRSAMIDPDGSPAMYGGKTLAEICGVTATDYFERMKGVNIYAGYEIGIELGSPNPNCEEREIALDCLYANPPEAPSWMERESADLLYQAEGRIRAVTSDVVQVIAAITPTRPLHWDESGELVEESEGELYGWQRASRWLGVISLPIARALWTAAVALSADPRRLETIRGLPDGVRAWRLREALSAIVNLVESGALPPTADDVKHASGGRPRNEPGDAVTIVYGDPAWAAEWHRALRLFAAAVSPVDEDGTPWTAPQIRRIGGKRRVEAMRRAIDGADVTALDEALDVG